MLLKQPKQRRLVVGIQDKRWPSCQQLEENDTHGVEVDAVIEVICKEHFRGHVSRCSDGIHGEAFAIRGPVLRRFGDPEVEHLQIIVFPFAPDEHEILWLEIAVDDVGIVGLLHCIAELQEDVLAKSQGREFVAIRDEA